MAQKSNNNSKSHAPVKVTEAEGKEKALKTAMEQIEKNFGKGAVMRLGENVAMNVGAIHTGSAHARFSARHRRHTKGQNS